MPWRETQNALTMLIYDGPDYRAPGFDHWASFISDIKLSATVSDTSNFFIYRARPSASGRENQ